MSTSEGKSPAVDSELSDEDMTASSDDFIPDSPPQLENGSISNGCHIDNTDNDRAALSSVPGCNHYKRRCLFVSPCCGKVVPCRICHDEEADHVLNRHAVSEVVCLQCETKQIVSNSCTSCGVEFGKYFCSVCRLFDDAEKGQFHCDECGICRVGGRENYSHCSQCCLCLPHDVKESHKCIEKNSHQNCPVCMEDIHTSRDSCNIAKCGHLMHSKCYREYIRRGNYRCPSCGVSMEDMESYWKMLDDEIKHTPMPDEYADSKSWILCKDCQKVCSALFHVLGMKCHHCGSYNTCSTAAPASIETQV